MGAQDVILVSDLGPVSLIHLGDRFSHLRVASFPYLSPAVPLLIPRVNPAHMQSSNISDASVVGGGVSSSPAPIAPYTVRGAAGGSILNAELLVAKGYL